MAKDQKISKITKKDIAEMSAMDFLDEAKMPYRRLMGYVLPYKGRFFSGVLLGIAAGLFNFVLLFGLKFVFAMVLHDQPAPGEKPFNQFDIPFIQKHVVIPYPEIGQEGQLPLVIGICMIIPLLILIRGLLDFLSQYYMIWVGNRVLFQLRDDVFSSLLGQSQRFYNKAKQGDLIQVVFNQTRIAQMAGTQLTSDMIKHPISILSIVIFLLMQNAMYTFAALVIFPLCLLPVLYVSKKVRAAGGKEEEEASQIMVTMQESFAGIRVVKAHAREDYERKRFNDGNEKMFKYIMRWRKAMEIVGPLVESVASVGMAAGLVYAWATQMSAGQFVLLNMALMGMYPNAKALSRIQIQLQKCLMATSKIFSIMDDVPEIQDSPKAITLKDCKGNISFENATFSYVKDKPAIRNVDLNFEAGKNYALVGQSGAGKSTIMSLIMRFYDPTEGTVRVDGHDIRDIAQRSLRDNIGIVNQEVFLFHDSIYNNILYGRLDATRKEVEAAARQAHAHDFILEQANGYETVIGDKGCNLSGGQQQRISIARAILRNAPILLLDEAYSALDSEAEKKIHEAMETLAQGKTVIAIAHRLSTVLNADELVVMKDGQVEAMGPHSQLLETCPEYQNLYHLQFAAHEDSMEAAAAV